MTTPIDEEITYYIQRVMRIPVQNRNDSVEVLQMILDKTVSHLGTILNTEQIQNIRNISLGRVKKDYGVRFAIKRTQDSITIGDWLFDLQVQAQSYLLYFIIVKESILHFVQKEITDVDELIINIISILWIKDLINVTTFDHPAIGSIGSRIYSTDIAGFSYSYWNSLLMLLFSKGITFKQLFDKYQEIIKNTNLTEEEIGKQFSKWVIEKTVREEDVIAPIYLNSKLINLVETLVDLGYENGSTSAIAKKLKTHQNTVRNYFKDLMSTYSTFWLANIDFARLNLHNYFLKIEMENDKSSQKLLDYIGKLPYLKKLYQGYSGNSYIIYSPSLTCPHLFSEILNNKLRSFKDKGNIKDYNLQLIRERLMYGTVTNYPYNPTINLFEKLMNKDDSYLTKFTFSHEKRDFSMVFDDDPVTFDYNQLYFLSLIKGKFLLKARYSVWVNELTNFYQKNNIPLDDVIPQTDLLNQLEIRARKKGILNYTIFMRNFTPTGTNIMVFELLSDTIAKEKELTELLDKLRVFSFMGQMTLYDRIVLTLPGTSHDHPIKNVIKQVIDSSNIDSNFYTIKIYKSIFNPLHELFDFEDRKWKIFDV